LAEKIEGRETRDLDVGGKRRYEQPEIAWEEEYKPTAFGISCAKVPADLGCAALVRT
jgi:hypothetical protein